ncbi:hypothetical protein A0U90_12940 [Kozakia baliensis]|nr:hypothetical protein A0U90_12940 [Kozakia baliensis]
MRIIHFNFSKADGDRSIMKATAILRSSLLALLCLSGKAEAQSEKPRLQTVWCSVPDSNEPQLFISNPVQFASHSFIVINTYSGRFARTVNARFGQHLPLESNYCHSFPNASRAAMARADVIARASAHNVRIMTVSVF